jgi:outer membrane protein OmpA-like peptidoglycan-associated protein
LTPLSLFSSSDDYPSIQDVPALPGRSLRPGDTWEARAWISIDPRRSRNVLRLPVAVGYRYAGLETWNGSPAHRVEAQFATRYPLPPSDDPNAPTVAYDGPITAVTGRHTMTIVIPVPPADGQVRGDVAFIRDEVAEQYLFSDRNELTVHGHTLLFLSAHAVETLQRVAESVERSMRETEVADVSVDRTATGVRLTVRSLRFLPDQAVLLPEERGRLDSVAEALGALDAQRFLVVGHTADVGSEESQRRLSIERARVIAAELAARGIARDRLDIEGRGGSEPVASNETDEGRARNRRVEIYIVEE